MFLGGRERVDWKQMGEKELLVWIASTDFLFNKMT